MRTRYYNAKILTGKDRNIKEGEMWVRDDKIEAVVFDSKASEEKFDQEVDLEGNLLMPSLKDAHTHTAMTFARSLADEYELNTFYTLKNDVTYKLRNVLKTINLI